MKYTFNSTNLHVKFKAKDQFLICGNKEFEI
jgi:hypothetical protein